MSKISLTPNASGTGTFTIASPNSNSDRTVNLPDAGGDMVLTTATQTLTNKTIDASQLVAASVTATQLATAVQPVGVGQTWQNVTGSRALGTTYTNSTGRPIQVNAWGDGNAFQDRNIQLIVNGVLVDASMASEGSSGGGVGNVSAIVPSGATYVVSFNIDGVLQGWIELR
jgi:hypothetical protein